MEDDMNTEEMWNEQRARIQKWRDAFDALPAPVRQVATNLRIQMVTHGASLESAKRVGDILIEEFGRPDE